MELYFGTFSTSPLVSSVVFKSSPLLSSIVFTSSPLVSSVNFFFKVTFPLLIQLEFSYSGLFGNNTPLFIVGFILMMDSAGDFYGKSNREVSHSFRVCFCDLLHSFRV